jgi:hypothetical protein
VSELHGIYRDLGDIVTHYEVFVKGRHFSLVFHIGPHLDLPVSERPAPQPPQGITTPGRIDLLMDLGADKKVELAATLTDELGHPVPAPTGTTVTWAVDNTIVINLVVNPDDSATAEATGELGNAIVSVVVTLPTGPVVTGDLLISVVAGEAERVEIVPGAISEVTPDV